MGPARPGLGARERSASASKRPRIKIDDDSQHPLDQGHGKGQGIGGVSDGGASRKKDKDRSRRRSKQYVGGTLNTNQNSTRKMKSPPADIIIYGVHKDTTEADIMNDLRNSDMIIEEKDK